MMKWKRWLTGFLAIVLAGLTGCAALVIFVDPFFQYHKPLAWFPYLVDNQVNQNPGLARNMDYEGVLLGSSMTTAFNTDWFEEVLSIKTQKLSYNGAYPKDEANIMDVIFEAKGDSVKAVFMAVDERTCSAGVEETKFPITDAKYLYDSNPFNDAKYLWNKDVLLNYILRPLADPEDASDWSELYKPWWTDEYYEKAPVLMYYTPAEIKEEALPEDYFLEGLYANLEKNICPYIEAHPETEFYIFYPPYSILYWNDIQRSRELDAVIKRLEVMTERFLGYDNVRVFSFLNQRDIILNLNNYADYTHYHKDICRYITDCFGTGECELSLENYKEHFADLANLAATYDYESIWDDWYDPTPRFYEGKG